MLNYADSLIARATLSVDLSAVRENYRLLAGMSNAECAAVLKANTYGLGIETVAPALAREGCRVFHRSPFGSYFVARASAATMHNICATRPMTWTDNSIGDAPVLRTA